MDRLIRLKFKADGYCGVCQKPVPKDFPNKFYCSYGCCRTAYEYFHKEEEEFNE